MGVFRSARPTESSRAATAAQGLNMTDVLLEFIQSYVAKNSTKQPKGRRG